MRANITISSEITIVTTHAPARNLVSSATPTAIAVSVAPRPLIAALARHGDGRARSQRRTSPSWLIVKPMNTPIVNSGIRRSVWASTTTNSRAAANASVTIPYR